MYTTKTRKCTFDTTNSNHIFIVRGQYLRTIFFNKRPALQKQNIDKTTNFKIKRVGMIAIETTLSIKDQSAYN